MAVAANKVHGIRAALMHDPLLAAAAQRDDAINVLALGSDYISLEKAQEVITQWLHTHFSGEERHQRRIDKISQFEQNTK
jgi:ribose 5-phosphate isomerase B